MKILLLILGAVVLIVVVILSAIGAVATVAADTPYEEA